MKPSILIICIVFIGNIAWSCKKNSSTTDLAPENLQIIAVVSNDNSGTVAFTATATNAISFEFDFGTGVKQTSEFGIVSYQYTQSGTYTVNVVAKSRSGKTTSGSTQVTISLQSGLIWSEEFDTPGSPDASKWTFELGDGCPNLCGWGNNEQQFYTNRTDNAIVSNGTLKITARKESMSGKNYTSARMITKGKFDFKYGKVEVRAKLPEGGGTWPAIWMLGANIDAVGWPNCGEIDIMEHKGNEPNVIHSTFHYPGRSGGNANTNTITITNASSDFHIYTLEWSATTIRMLVDNQVIHTLGNNSSLPFNQKFFLILNVAMGGNFGGNIAGNFVSSAMEVDYIRVYQ